MALEISGLEVGIAVGSAAWEVIASLDSLEFDRSYTSK